VIVERGTGSCETAGQDLRRGEWLIDGVTLNGRAMMRSGRCTWTSSQASERAQAGSSGSAV
jgi:hypothetical protein